MWSFRNAAGRNTTVSTADPLPVTMAGGGGSGGGAVTIADGADVAEGAKADAVYSSSDGSAAGTVVALLKGAYVRLTSLLNTNGAVADAAYSSADGSASGSQISLLKGLVVRLAGGVRTAALSHSVVPASNSGAFPVLPTNLTPTAGTNLSGTVTTTASAFSIPANVNRKPGDVQGQNVGANPIGFNEFGGTPAIGSAGTYTVAAGATFSITTNAVVNFIASGGSSAVTITGL